MQRLYRSSQLLFVSSEYASRLTTLILSVYIFCVSESLFRERAEERAKEEAGYEKMKEEELADRLHQWEWRRRNIEKDVKKGEEWVRVMEMELMHLASSFSSLSRALMDFNNSRR